MDGNGESQYYTSQDDNVIVENGLLKITARKENFEGANYTSARIKSGLDITLPMEKLKLQNFLLLLYMASIVDACLTLPLDGKK